MGMITDLFSMLFGGMTRGGGNVVKETVEVFRENAEAGAVRAHDMQTQALMQFAAEFQHERRGFFDRAVDAVNRLPRPAMALGVLALFVSAMTAPLWFAERMQGIALIPEPLWWLLGVVVSFYFGARHQAKAQSFQREVAEMVNMAPAVLGNINQIRAMEQAEPADVPKSEVTPGVADTGTDAELEIEATDVSSGNAALDEWNASRA